MDELGSLEVRDQGIWKSLDYGQRCVALANPYSSQVILERTYKIDKKKRKKKKKKRFPLRESVAMRWWSHMLELEEIVEYIYMCERKKIWVLYEKDAINVSN
jgi:hypothetical protein